MLTLIKGVSYNQIFSIAYRVGVKIQTKLTEVSTPDSNIGRSQAQCLESLAFFDIQHNKAVNPNSGLPSASLVLQSSKLQTNLGKVWEKKN